MEIPCGVKIQVQARFTLKGFILGTVSVSKQRPQNPTRGLNVKVSIHKQGLMQEKEKDWKRGNCLLFSFLDFLIPCYKMSLLLTRNNYNVLKPVQMYQRRNQIYYVYTNTQETPCLPFAARLLLVVDRFEKVSIPTMHQ